MSQRWIAFAVAAPLTFLLLLLVAFVPLPFAVYSPGPTYDVLAKDLDESEIIQVVGHKTYRDDGQIRFTTVRTSPFGERLSLLQALEAWTDPDRAVIPYDVAHPEDTTPEEEEMQGAVSMVTSQDVAIANAMEALGYEVTPVVQVAYVDEKGPSFGELRVRDKLLEADGRKVRQIQDVVGAVEKHGPGDPVELLVQRGRKRLTVEIEPRKTDGEMKIGVTLGTGYEFPFDVTITVDPAIGGPSAGLMFSLAVYDTLTPGSLTDGEVVAGTGELSPDGEVGPIGGIDQKIAGAEEAGAELFFVPAGNCDDVSDVETDMRLVKATTMQQALHSLEAWADDRDAELPVC